MKKKPVRLFGKTIKQIKDQALDLLAVALIVAALVIVALAAIDFAQNGF